MNTILKVRGTYMRTIKYFTDAEYRKRVVEDIDRCLEIMDEEYKIATTYPKFITRKQLNKDIDKILGLNKSWLSKVFNPIVGLYERLLSNQKKLDKDFNEVLKKNKLDLYEK